jgi:hypothetical protein
MTPDFLTVQDLINRAGAARVAKYFDDENDALVLATDPNVQAILKEAEGEAYSRMLRAYGSVTPIILLAQNDEVFRGHCAWVALEIASERRPEFTDAEGRGAHWQQYERALRYFDSLSKGRQRSRAESVAGRPSTVGGQIRPSPPAGTASNFVFAPSKDSPTGHGSFAWLLVFGAEIMRLLMMHGGF